MSIQQSSPRNVYARRFSTWSMAIRKRTTVNARACVSAFLISTFVVLLLKAKEEYAALHDRGFSCLLQSWCGARDIGIWLSEYGPQKYRSRLLANTSLNGNSDFWFLDAVWNVLLRQATFSSLSTASSLSAGGRFLDCLSFCPGASVYNSRKYQSTALRWWKECLRES